MKRSNLPLWSMLVFAVALALVGGCRRPQARWDWTTERPPPQLRPVGGDGLGDPGMGELGAWDPLAGAPSRLPGDLRQVEEPRITSVVVYFAYDRSTIGTSEQPKLETIAEHMRRNPEYHLVIEGHCDERGSAEYNRGLGERRALAVKSYLVNLGITGDRLNTVSYGIERPAVANARTEAEHAQNRRAEFLVGVQD